MKLTVNENDYLDRILKKSTSLASFLHENPHPPPSAPMKDWYEYHVTIKRGLGNHSNDLSLIACLLAKEFLAGRLPMEDFDSAAKKQGAPGLDIDERTTGGQRVIGEIKATFPYRKNDLGAQQKKTFMKDFDKLNRTEADHKFFFVTEQPTFELMREKYASCIPGVTVVCLLTGETYIAT